MSVSRLNITYLILSLLLSMALCIAHVMGSTGLIMIVLLLFLVLVLCGAIKGVVIPILLYFLPWSPVLKVTQGQMSYFTIALLLVSLIYLVFNAKKIRFNYLVSAIMILVVTMGSKLISGLGFDNSYIAFILLIFAFPALINEIKNYDFYTITCFFALGIITAALSAQQLVVYPNIAKFIDVYTFNEITRLSGYYADSNFYSAHITAALVGVLLLILQEKVKKKVVFLFILAVTLFYCGLLSGSKSFIIIFASIFIFWVLKILFMNGKVTSKIMLVVSIILIAMFVLSSTLFTDMIDMILGRLTESDDVSSLTTGRTDRWQLYIRVLSKDAKTLLIGKGFTNINIAGRSPHNVFIQTIYQFGIVGAVFLTIWITEFMRKALNGQNKTNDFLGIVILIIGIFGPWFALDPLFFDEFFLLQFYFCSGLIGLDSNIKVAKIRPLTGNEYKLSEEL